MSTMESLSLITTFCTFIACLLISHEEVATGTDKAVAIVVVAINICFVVVMALLFLKDSSTAVLKRVQDSNAVQRFRESEFTCKLRSLSQSYRQVVGIGKTQVQAMESIASEPPPNNRPKVNADSHPVDLFPVVPKATSADASQVLAILGEPDLRNAGKHDDETTHEEVSSVDLVDSDVESIGLEASDVAEELDPQNQIRTMMLAKEDEIQELKLKLHRLQRQSGMVRTASEPSNAAKSVPLDGAQIDPVPPSNLPEIEDGPDNGYCNRKQAPSPMVPVAPEDMRFVNREMRHGRLTDHVKLSANRGDLESFIAAT